MQRSLIAKSALIFLLAGGLLAQTSSKSGSTKKPAAKPATKSGATKTSAGTKTTGALPTKATVLSFLHHMFNYQPNMTFDVKDIKPLPGTQIADVAIDFKAGSAKPEEKHLYVLSDRKHAIAGAATAFDAPEPKMENGLPTQAAVIEFVRKHFLPSSTAGMQTNIRKSDHLPGIAEVTVAVQGGQAGGRLYVTTDGQWVFTGEEVPFGADPFASTRAALAKGNGISKGPATSPVTVVEFSDLECPACKAAQPTVDQVLAQEPDIHFVFQNFPLDQIHPWAFRAALYADCIGRENNTAFWKFVENTYADQSNISTTTVDSKLLDIAAGAGADRNRIKACVESPDTKAHVWASQALGREVEVQGTPTLFINGRKVASVTGAGVDNIKMLIEAAKKTK